MTPLPPELLERHGAPVPRYTSYPTAMHWGAAPSGAAWLAALDEALSPEGARAGLYVHTPFCGALCTFCGCNMRVARSHSLAAPYVATVLKEHSLYRTGLRARPALAALHLGGGSPSWLPAESLDRLLEGLLTDIPIADNADFAIEADPRNTTREKLGVLRRHGFRRIEIGVQDFDTRVLEIVNRVQAEEEVRRVVDDARDLAFTSVGFDLIYGLPLQTVESLRSTFDSVLRLRPDRVNFLPYAHVPWIRSSQRQYTDADLPEAALRRELFLLGRNRLGAAGYVEIGIDQYALPSDPIAQALTAGTLSRSFMGFSATAIDALIGLGVSAMGDARKAYAQNEKNLQQYEARLAANELPLQRGHVLNSSQRRIRQLLWEIFAGSEAALLADDLASPWWPAAQQRLALLQEDGLVQVTPDAIRVTATGRAFLRQVAAAIAGT
ncbi:MAG TPA: oxygen-independent coproporphyrinogen III oxidase [Steroidobacteraceae bacterium]|nr:oxygen-independent coproporphyrinogen III oxidase [Steroidobacteraceae bacterium]